MYKVVLDYKIIHIFSLSTFHRPPRRSVYVQTFLYPAAVYLKPVHSWTLAT